MIEEFKGKKVLVLGLGRSGRAAARLLAKMGASGVIANDRKEISLLEDEAADLLEYSRVKLIGGGHPESLLQGISLIIKSPGIKPGLALLQKARVKGIPIYSEIELAFHFSPVPLIGITGTNGKTTTASLLGEIFRHQFHEVYVAGNIGLPLCKAVMEVTRSGIIVAELSSFQLEDIRDFRVHIAAVLYLNSDHLDYHETMGKYVGAKKKIFMNQSAEDWLVLNRDDPLLKTFGLDAGGKILPFSHKEEPSPGVYVKDHRIVINDGKETVMVCSVDTVRIPGLHNLKNALAAAAVAWAAGVKPENIARGLKTFPGVPHRLEKIIEIKGVTFVNDSKGTNPDATLHALQAVPGSKVLIAGGMNKGSDFRPLVQVLAAEGVKSLVLLGETAPLIAAIAGEEGFFAVSVAADMAAAVQKAFSLAVPGDTVLLSPACASWDMFKYFEERGDFFRSAVLSLKEAFEGEKCPHGA